MINKQIIYLITYDRGVGMSSILSILINIPLRIQF